MVTFAINAREVTMPYTMCDECKYITAFGHAKTCSHYEEPPERTAMADRALVIRGTMTEVVARDEIITLLTQLNDEGKEIDRIVIEVIDPSASLARTQELMLEMFPGKVPPDVLPVELMRAMVEFCDNAVPALLNKLWTAGARARAIELAKRIKELRGPTYKWPAY